MSERFDASLPDHLSNLRGQFAQHPMQFILPMLGINPRAVPEQGQPLYLVVSR